MSNMMRRLGRLGEMIGMTNVRWIIILIGIFAYRPACLAGTNTL